MDTASAPGAVVVAVNHARRYLDHRYRNRGARRVRDRDGYFRDAAGLRWTLLADGQLD